MHWTYNTVTILYPYLWYASSIHQQRRMALLHIHKYINHFKLYQPLKTFYYDHLHPIVIGFIIPADCKIITHPENLY